MKYSIVIVSKDNRNFLLKCLDTLKKYVVDDVEIVLVESGNNLTDLDFKLKHIKIPLLKAGYSYQRNLGIKNSSGDYVIFIDDDIEVFSNWFEEIIKVFEDENVLGCMGAVFPKDANLLSFSLGVLGHPGGGFYLFDKAKGKVIPVSLISTGNSILKKSVIEEVGYFDEEGSKFGSEDTEICLRIAKKFGENRLRYNPQAIVWHYTPDKFCEIVKWYLRRGKKDIEIMKKYKLSLVYFVNFSILLKMFMIFIFSLSLGINFLLLISILWFLWQLYKYRFMLKYLKYYPNFKYSGIIVLVCFPFVKFIVDVVFDIGRLVAVTNNVFRKIDAKKS
ncbi:MAG: glycosyltransferase [Endomicrobiia bacterium]